MELMMRRGEIYFCNLDPTIGSEIKKTRPVIIVSNNASNKASNLLTVIPLTSNINKVYPFEVLLEKVDSGLTKNSKIQCHQIRTVSKERLSGKRKGAVNATVMIRIEKALKLHLGLF